MPLPFPGQPNPKLQHDGFDNGLRFNNGDEFDNSHRFNNSDGFDNSHGFNNNNGFDDLTMDDGDVGPTSARGIR